MTSEDRNPTLVQALSRAERYVARRLAEIAAAHGATVEQWRVLNLLGDGAGHPMKEIADHAGVPAPTATRIIDRMVADNLVYRRIDPGDRRRSLVFAAARGDRLHESLRRDIERYEADLTATDLGSLTDLLLRLIEHHR